MVKNLLCLGLIAIGSLAVIGAAIYMISEAVHDRRAVREFNRLSDEEKEQHWKEVEDLQSMNDPYKSRERLNLVFTRIENLESKVNQLQKENLK